MWKRCTLLTVGSAVALLVFGDTARPVLYHPWLVLGAWALTFFAFGVAFLASLDKAVSKQYEITRRRSAKVKPILDELATPVPDQPTLLQTCQRCGGLSVVNGMCLICDVEVGIL